MKPAVEKQDLGRLERSSAQSVVAMEYPPRVNMSSSLHHSRVQRLMTVQELLLEYSLVIVFLGCFILLLLPIKGLRTINTSEDAISWM